MQQKIRVGITQGDINSISYEVIIKTFMDSRMLSLCTPVVYGSPKVASYYRKALNIDNFSFNTISDVNEANEKKANLINCIDDNVRVELGKANEQGAEAAIKSLTEASKDLANGKIDVLITCPVNAEQTQKINPNFIGNKEFLCSALQQNDSMLLLLSDHIKVGMVSEQVPFTEITSHITKENIINKLKILQQSLQQGFKINKPKIAVLGLNPSMANVQTATQEQEVIIPAIKQANKDENILAVGTFHSDTFFTFENINKFDAILAMYYDQAVSPLQSTNIPIAKYVSGLSSIVIEPDFDLNYDIAGMGKAIETPLREAIYQAIDIFDNRNLHKEVNKNPLQE